MGSAVTDSSGAFAATVRPAASTVYRVRYAGEANRMGSIGPEMVVAVRSTAKLVVGKASAKLGTTFVFTGTTKPALSGDTVTLQTKSGTKWKDVATVKTTKGTATFKVKPKKKGTYSYRVRKNYSGNSGESYSGTVKIKAT